MNAHEDMHGFRGQRGDGEMSDVAEIRRLVEVAEGEQEALTDLGACMGRLRVAVQAKSQLARFDAATVQSVIADRAAGEARCA